LQHGHAWIGNISKQGIQNSVHDDNDLSLYDRQFSLGGLSVRCFLYSWNGNDFRWVILTTWFCF